MLPKHLTLFLTFCWVIVIGVCIFLFYTFFQSAKIENRIFVCGNALMGNYNDTAYADGKAIFYSNCASCHNPIKDATGPALGNITTFRSQEWICKFLTKPKFIPKDKRAIELRKNFGLSCTKFPMLKCEEVKAALRYLEFYKLN